MEGIGSLRGAKPLFLISIPLPLIRGCLVVIIRGCLVVIARHEVPKQSLKVIVRLLRGACPERHEILRYAQNDTKRRARNGSLSW